jgi:hypothetical protein
MVMSRMAPPTRHAQKATRRAAPERPMSGERLSYACWKKSKSSEPGGKDLRAPGYQPDVPLNAAMIPALSSVAHFFVDFFSYQR